jgi:shikimate dehydrogenase
MGINAECGLYMLVAQAVRASEIFLDTTYPKETIDKVYSKILLPKRNIVLTGMPSCGKTSVGKALSERLSNSFVDSDSEIVVSEGKPIPEIFAEKGEEYFRGVETDVIHSLALQNTRVIATGGGAVLNKSNTDILRENGRIYFINRPLEELITTDDRPLSSNREMLEKRYNERYSIYASSADVIVDGRGSVEEVADRIEADYSEYLCD